MKKVTEYEYDEQGRVTRMVEEDGLMSERHKRDGEIDDGNTSRPG